jgi:DNA-binding NtrC family response regulator
MQHSQSTHLLEVAAFSVKSFRMRVVKGPDAGAVIQAARPELTIGTDRTNDLQLSDTAASRHHCTITSTPRGAVLRDLGSTNGTFLHGCRVDSIVLRPHIQLAVGRNDLVFEPVESDIVEPLSAATHFGPLMGTSLALRRIFATLPRVASANATLLLEGETGTGKSSLGKAIHDQSSRSAGPFVVIDCGAIPESLIESELFGHERGSFTGAHAQKHGLFEAANGGTLLLDEIGELPLSLQPRLLRALEERLVRRIGGHNDIEIDARVIAATNRDLRAEVNRGNFRSDLFYRLNTVRIVIPPLRERPEDIDVLARSFWARAAPDAGDPPPELLARFRRGRWPGNVRELRAAIERTLILGSPPPCDGDPVARPEVGDPTDERPFRDAKADAIDRWERTYLTALIRRHDGNISGAARAAKMNRNHLRDLLMRRDIEVR